jgi:DNA helicase-2/ATP-dependent DNA helicase PcrA
VQGFVAEVARRKALAVALEQATVKDASGSTVDLETLQPKQPEVAEPTDVEPTEPTEPAEPAEPLERTGAAEDELPPTPDPIDESSIVEALDDLPRPGWTDRQGRALSESARQRLTRLAESLRRLRSLSAMPLAELVVETERELGLDVELGSRPGVSYAAARAHVDALADVASGFAATSEGPTLSAFLAWLAAAEVRERGLTPGQVDQTAPDTEATPIEGRPEDVEVSRDAVQVLTVHAAKGLEWDIVAIPGLVEGVLPYDGPQPRADKDTGEWVQGDDRSTGWRPISSGGVPYGLRGDAAALPELRLHACVDGKDAEAEWADFERRMGSHAIAEERRLAYVAITRARHELLLAAHVWGTPVKTPRLPSRFLLEALGDPDLSQGPPPDGGAYGVEVRPDWATVPPPAPDLMNPLAADPAHQAWPFDPLGARRPTLEAAAARVRAALSASGGPDRQGRPAGPAESLTGEPAVWTAEIQVLLAERDRARRAEVDVALPTHLSASRLVRLAEDPHALAIDLRRPMPQPPAPEARRGTAFHAWVERRFGAAAIVDVLELPGAADEGPADDDLLPELQANFLASEWAERVPSAIEVAIETPVAGTVVRGRIDAVFPVGDGTPPQRWDVVDWKTGAEPREAAASARAVQLAAYRLAWARLQDVPVENVGAAFFYAATGRTVRPVDLLDEAALERLVTGG